MKNHLLHHLQAVCMLIILSMLSIPETFAAGPNLMQSHAEGIKNPNPTNQEFNSIVENPDRIPIEWINDSKSPWGYTGSSLQTTITDLAETTLTAKVNLDKPYKIKIKGKELSNSWFNGTLYININGVPNEENIIIYSNYDFSMEAVLPPGENVIEWHFKRNPSYTCWIELQSIQLTSPWVEVSTQAGNLGIEVLKQVNQLQDVEFLKVNGQMNDEDWAKIEQMTNLWSVDLENTDVTSIRKHAFLESPNLEFLKLPKNLQTLEAQAFETQNLRSIDIPASLTAIHEKAFYKCKKLRHATIQEPSKLQWIDDKAFAECESLEEFIIPQSVNKMGDDIFSSCKKMQKIVFPETLTEIPAGVCSYVKALESFNWPRNVTSIGKFAFSRTPLKKLRIPEQITSIGAFAFEECPLDSIILPEGLTDLGSGVFCSNDSLRYIKLPSCVPAYDGVFSSCDSIETVELPSVTPPATWHPFPEDKSRITLKVPSFSVNNYKLDEYWYQFGHIEPLDENPQFWNIGNHFTYYNDVPLGMKPEVHLLSFPKYVGTMTVNGDAMLSMKDFTLVWDYYKDEDLTHCQLLNESNMRADSVTLYMTNPNGYWIFFTLPFDVKVSDIVAEENTNWVIRTYDGAARALGNMDQTWTRVTPDDVLKAGQGYIMQSAGYGPDAYRDPTSTFTFHALNNTHKNNIFSSENVYVDLKAYPAEFAHNRGWNQIGNPYPCFYDTRFMDFKAPITIWNKNKETYEAYSPLDDGYILQPGESFLVQCPVGETSIQFQAEGRQLDRKSRTINVQNSAYAGQTQPRYVVNLELSSDQPADRTRIVFNEAADTGYEMDKDAHKFMSLNHDVAQLYTSQGKTPYAINERPLDNGQVELNVHTGKPGWYTLSVQAVPAGFNLLLEDKLQGTRQALSPERPYSFDARPADQPDRFVLYFNAEETGIDNIENAHTECEDLYDLQGKKINKPYQQGIYIDNGKKVLLNQ